MVPLSELALSSPVHTPTGEDLSLSPPAPLPPASPYHTRPKLFAGQKHISEPQLKRVIFLHRLPSDFLQPNLGILS